MTSRLLPSRADGSVVAGVASTSVRCPVCAALDDKVVDSRVAEDGVAIRRRRVCLLCGHRFTTFERVEGVAVVVDKRSGAREPFDREKIIAGLRSAAKSRPITDPQLVDLAIEIEETVRSRGRHVVPSAEIGLAVLERLRELDQVAYVRFASVYKGFDDPADFEREVTLLTKETEPKRRPSNPVDRQPTS